MQACMCICAFGTLTEAFVVRMFQWFITGRYASQRLPRFECRTTFSVEQRSESASNRSVLLHEDLTNGCQSTRTCDLQKCLGNFGKEVDNSTARNICSPGSLHLSYILSLWCAGQHIARRISEGHKWEFLVSVSVILSLGHFPILILLRIRHCRCRKPWRPLQPWFQCRWPRSLPCLRTGLTFSLRLVPLFFKFLWSNRLQLQGCMGN